MVKTKGKSSKKSASSSSLLSQIWNVFVTVGGAIVGLVLTGFFVNWVLLQYEERNVFNEPIGEFVTLQDGRKINYLCEGNEDAKETVWIIPGVSTNYLFYEHILRKFSNSQRRICSYARVGHLWSSPAIYPDDFEPNQVSSQFYEVVTQVTKPSSKIILTGHSLGGLHTACFAVNYTDFSFERLILVDPAPTVMFAESIAAKRIANFYKTSEIMAVTGFHRLMSIIFPQVYEESMSFFEPNRHSTVMHFLFKASTNQVYQHEITLAMNFVEWVHNFLKDKKKPILSIPIDIILAEKLTDNNDLGDPEEINLDWKTLCEKDHTLKEDISSNVKIQTLKGTNHRNLIYLAYEVLDK